MEYTAADEIAVCNLGSLALPKFVKDGEFDHDKLFEVTYQLTINLNKIIDGNYYPVPETRNSNMRHRPIGIGVQGLADAFILMRFPFDGEEARKLNKEVFETIYYAACTASKDLAKVDGAYQTFEGSPASKGILQFDMWNVQPSNRWEWDVLKEEIKQFGMRNSLLLAPMPTASTAQILGNNECFEPYTSNIYTRRVLAGEYIIVNKHLLKDLVNLGIWNEDLKNKVIAANGSVQNIAEIPDNLKALYKTAWELSQKAIIEMSAERGAFICQSQSLNVFMENPNFGKLTSMHFYAWERGLKTGMYYLRTKAATDAIKFTVEKKYTEQPSGEAQAAEVLAAATSAAAAAVTVGETQQQATMNFEVQSPYSGQSAEEIAKQQAAIACSLDNPDACEMCSG
jgi:ribonucleoside-diphosphate reductase alpha chain